MKLLAIDTSTDACSVALMVGNDVKVDHRTASRQHAALVLPMIDTLFAQMGVGVKELDAVVFGQGPGSFTGVRIGVAVAQGIAFGADVGVIGVSTLQSIGQGCLRLYGDKDIHVCIDARMDEVYYCHFAFDKEHGMQPTSEETICPPDAIEMSNDSIALKDPSMHWAGSGAQRYEQILRSRWNLKDIAIRQHSLPDAQDLLSLAVPVLQNGGALPAEKAAPVYLRNNVAKTTEERDRERALKSSGS